MFVNEIKCKSLLNKTTLASLDYTINPYFGCQHGCVYCLHPDTQILTTDGFIKIEEMKDKTTVISHSGMIRRKTAFHQHFYNGALRKLKPHYFEELFLTPNHKILAAKKEDYREKYTQPTMIEAGKLRKGDFVFVPIAKQVKDSNYIRVSDVLSHIKKKHKKGQKKLSEKVIQRIFVLRKKHLSHREIGKRLGISYTAVYDYLNGRSSEPEFDVGIVLRGNNVKFKGAKKGIPNVIPLNPSFLRLVGYYLSEGCVSISSNRPNSAYVAFTFHEKEQKYIKDAISLLKRFFKIEPNIIQDKKSKTIHIHSGVGILALFFSELFGAKSHEMHLPPSFLFLPVQKQKGVIRGLFRGDGSTNIQKSTYQTACFATTSPNLKNSVQMILLRCGIISGIQRSAGGKRKNCAYFIYPASQCRSSFTSLFGINKKIPNGKIHCASISDKYVISPIKQIGWEVYSGNVYNLSVEKDRSYTANFVAVSNCYCHQLAKRFSKHTEQWGDYVDVKVNAPEILEQEIKKKKPAGTVWLSSASDPYQPVEKEYELTRNILEILANSGLKADILTKGSFVVRDADVFEKFGKDKIIVGFTVNMLNDHFRRDLEPFAAPVERRIEQMDLLRNDGIPIYASFGPIFPEMTDIPGLFETFHELGIKYVFTERLNVRGENWAAIKRLFENKFPELLQMYEKIFFDKKAGDAWHAEKKKQIEALAKKYGMKCDIYFDFSKKFKTS